MGFRLTINKQNEFAREIIHDHRDVLGDVLVDALMSVEQTSEKGIAAGALAARAWLPSRKDRRLERLVGDPAQGHRRHAGQAQRLDHRW